MPSATAKAAPTAKVSTVTTTKVVTDPVEQIIPPAALPAPEASEDFWKYIQSLNHPEDWKKTSNRAEHTVGLYRYPLGQTKPQKLGRYVKTYKGDCPLVSEDQIFEEFGGGQYDALLRGPHPDDPSRSTLLAKHSWEMDGPAKNPWQVSTGSPGAPGAPAVPSELASTLQVVLQNLKQAEKSTSSGEQKAITESIGLIQQLTAAMPKPQGVGELVSALADLKKLTGAGEGGNSLVETIRLLKELGVIGGERKSLASEIKEIMEIAGLMNGGGAPASGGRVHWATSLVQTLPTILEKVTPIADKFADAARNNARVAELRTGAPIPVQPPARPSPAIAPPPASPAAATAPAAESPAPRVVAMPETEPAGSPSSPEFVAPNIEWVKARAVQLFQRGKPGDEIAEWLDGLDDQLANFLGSMSPDQFREFVKSDPILSQIAQAARFDEFVEQFTDYFSSSGYEKET